MIGTLHKTKARFELLIQLLQSTQEHTDVRGYSLHLVGKEPT
jgi:hypothetical protein